MILNIFLQPVDRKHMIPWCWIIFIIICRRSQVVVPSLLLLKWVNHLTCCRSSCNQPLFLSSTLALVSGQVVNIAAIPNQCESPCGRFTGLCTLLPCSDTIQVCINFGKSAYGRGRPPSASRKQTARPRRGWAQSDILSLYFFWARLTTLEGSVYICALYSVTLWQYHVLFPGVSSIIMIGYWGTELSYFRVFSKATDSYRIRCHESDT